ncbi:hypothetical protein RJT34_03420 [Clitoria ternatea]|uniref:Amino acid permease/ SLC12A domain-containing protein n=1 Tax=Clitoria ternatea TaxID=43366 RepID=A0AAN9KMY6_CLITE
MKAFSLTLACQFFLGIDEPHLAEKLAIKFDDLCSGLYSVPVYFPGSAYIRALKASASIRKEIQLLIKGKIDALSNGHVMDDLLAHIVGAEKDGKYMPKLEIVGLIHASYTQMAVTLAFMIKHIGQSPDIYQRIISENADIRKSKGSLDWEDIQKLKYTWAVAQESMRLYPAAPGTFREATTDITYEGFTIPKGWKIFWAIIGTNKNPRYFHEPESFDPSRFEENVPAPYTYVPFGVGPRSSPGKDYTRYVILTFIHSLITKFKWEVMLPDEKVYGTLIPTPVEGIPILSTMAEETKNPVRDMPIGLVGSMMITTLGYCLLAVTLCLLQSYKDFDVDVPFSVAFSVVGWDWAKYIVALGALKGMTTMLLVNIVGESRYLTHIA